MGMYFGFSLKRQTDRIVFSLSSGWQMANVCWWCGLSMCFFVVAVIAQQFACRWFHAKLSTPPPIHVALCLLVKCMSLNPVSKNVICLIWYLIFSKHTPILLFHSEPEGLSLCCYMLQVLHSVATRYRSFILLLRVTGPSLCCYMLKVLHSCYTLQVLHSVATCYRSFTLLLCVCRSFTLLLCTTGHSLCCYMLQVIRSVATWYRSFTLLHCVSLWGKHGSDSSGFSCRLFVRMMGWLAPGTSLCIAHTQAQQEKEEIVLFGNISFWPVCFSFPVVEFTHLENVLTLLLFLKKGQCVMWAQFFAMSLHWTF